ncbi:hypothetical protein ACWQEN_002007 [Morganella morganii]
MKKLRSLYGSYTPSCFLMQVDEEYTEENKEPLSNRTFFHEYIHYLQDIILPFCLKVNLVSMSSVIQLKEIYCSEQKIITPVHSWNDDYYTTKKQLDWTWGETKDIYFFGMVVDIRREEEPSIGDIRVIKYIMKSIIGLEYTLGARDFLEYIVVSLEKRIWHDVPYYEIPYKTVDLLFNYMGLNSISEDVRFILIEYSLYNDNPVNQLLITIERFKSKIIRYSNNPREIKKLLLNDRWYSRGNWNYEMKEKRDKRIGQLIEFSNILYKGPSFCLIKDWFLSIANNSFLNEREFIFYDLLNSSKVDLLVKLKSLIRDIGIPLVSYKNEIKTYLDSKYNHNEFKIFISGELFVNNVMLENKMCPMYECYLCGGSEANLKWCESDYFQTLSLHEKCDMNIFFSKHGLLKFEFFRFNITK